VRHVRRMSNEAHADVNGPIDLLYVDGAHRYAPARADIEQWGARVRPGGTMLVHDSYNALGVMLAQMRVLFTSTSWRFVGRTRSLAEYRRQELATRARVANLVSQLAGVPYFIRNGLIKITLLLGMRPAARLLGLPEDDPWPY
jgi:hypothetical protein